jgi:hypothetical protein
VSKLYYLATVYTKHVGGAEMAFEEAAAITASLASQNIVAFCPIAHSHPVAAFLPPELRFDHDFWVKMDAPLLERCDELIFVQMQNSGVSRGMAHERDVFEALGRPIRYMPYDVYKAAVAGESTILAKWVQAELLGGAQ